MKISVSRHVFGSIRGYTTLAKSKDLSSEETTTLEILSFGQTNESSYLDSLQTNPAYISRPFHAGKWAVTRVFKGKTDEHNRITLLFISAVITIDDWLYSLKCDVNKLLYYPWLWQWNGEEKLESIEITVESRREIPGPELRNKVLSLLAAVEKYTRDKNTTIVVKTSEFDAEALRWLNMLLPLASKQTFSCTARSLNDGLPFALISMAKEGAFGNSRRRTVNWILTSDVDNCQYAESITQFWQPGGEPPWQFIDSCKSFLIDLGGEPQLEQRKRLLTKKPLIAELVKPKIKRKTYFSRKLAVILFTCAVVACLATVVTIGAMRFKANKELRFLIETNIKKAQNTRYDKHLPPDPLAITIKQDEDLRRKLEVLLDRTKDPQLKVRLTTAIGNLNKRLKSKGDAHKRYGFLSNRSDEFSKLNIEQNPRVYPAPERIQFALDLEKGISKVDKANLAPNYVSQARKILQTIDRWRNKIKNLLEAKENAVTQLTELVRQERRPKNYSEKQYEKYDDFKQKLENFKEDESLTNSKDSPIEEHQKIAKEISDKLGTALADCNRILQKMDGLKKDAKKSFNDANDILSDPNITDCTVDAISKLVQARSHLDKARELWPKMPNLDGLNQKFTNNLVEILKKSEDEIKKMAKVEAPEKPDVHRIKVLRKILEKAKLISEKSNVQKIDDQLQRLENLEKKAMDVQASSLNSEEQMRSNGL